MRTLLAMTVLMNLVLGNFLFAADAAPSDKSYRYLTVCAPKLKQAPTIDGKVDAVEWAGAGMAPRVYLAEEDRLTDLESKFYFAYTDDAFYVAFQVQRPEGAIEPRANIVERDRSFWRVDDCLELWLNTIENPARRKGYRDFYLMWNARGSQYDRRDNDGNLKWNPNWQVVSRTVPGYGWEGELRMPFKEISPTPVPKSGDEWRYNLSDNRATPFPLVAQSMWGLATLGSYGTNETFARLKFTGDADAFVRVLDSGVSRVGGKGGAVFEIVNPGGQPQKIASALKLYRKKSDSKMKSSFLRSFEQTRDTGDTSDAGKVLLMISDDKLSATIIEENYDLVKDQNEATTLNAGERKTIDFALASQVGDYLLLYEFRKPDGKIIAGGPLPFIMPESLEVKYAAFFLVDQSVTAKIDLRYVPGWKKDGPLEARVYPTNEPATMKATRRWTGEELREIVDYKFPTSDLKSGDYILHLTAKDASGKVLAERKAPLVVPAMPKWFTEKAGLTPAVPEPWTPINASDDVAKVSFLMGDYELGDAGLARQVNVRSIYEEQKVPILRSPIALRGKADGKEIAWSGGKATFAGKKPEEVNVKGGATAGNLAVSSDITFEYDGMAKINLTLSPAVGQKVDLDELYLQVPLKKEFSQLYLRGTPLETTKDFLYAGKLPEQGLKHLFVNSVWLGNEERGFRWFAENMKGWHVGRKFNEEAIEVLNGPEGATLKLNLVKDDKPFVLDKPRTITLAYMFTPPKTVRRDLVKLATTLTKEYEGKAGVSAFELWYFKNQGWPEIADEKERQEKLAFAQEAHSFGGKLTPYGGWFIHRQSQVYSVFGSEMIVDPLIDGGVGCDVCCWNTPIQDANAGLYAGRIKDIELDGFRLDAGFSVDKCSSLMHRGYGSDCGWIDDDGNLQGSKPLFAARRAAQRAYRLFHGGGRDHGMCIQHVHQGNRFDPILANMDAVLSVEGIEMSMKSLEELPLDFYRANVMGDAHGYQVVYLPKSRAMGCDSFYGLAALHNLLPRGGYPVAYSEVSYSRDARSPREFWRAREWIGPYDPGTEFWGYWKNAKLLDTGSKSLVGSFHVRRGEQVLLGVMNLQRKAVAGKVRLDLKELGFGEKVYAYDPILKEAVVLDNGTLDLTFFPEGYRLIEIAAKPFDIFVPEKLSENLIPEADPAKWPGGAAPAGWQATKTIDDKTPMTLTDADVSSKDSGMNIVSNGETSVRFQKQIGQPGKFFMLEGEATIDCDNAAFLGEWPDASNFQVIFGDPYFGDKRTITSQPVPGTTQKFRLFAQDTGVISVGLRKAKGRATIKKLEMYEVKSLPPAFQVGKYGK